MAQDSGLPNPSNSEINIDDLDVEIYIICKNPDALKATCAFLTRREWPTQATSQLPRAIEYIAEHRPDIVMISFSHPSPTLLKLPDIISQTFGLTCIGFVEGSDAASMQRLNSSRVRHKIAGQPSGPNFHRTIRRILQERFSVVTEDKAAIAGLKPESADSGSASILAQNANLTSEMALANMYQSADSNTPKASSGIIIQKGNGGVGAGTLLSSGTPQAPVGPPAVELIDSESRDVVSSGKYTMGKTKRRSLKEITRQERAAAKGGSIVFGQSVEDTTGEGLSQENTSDLVNMLKKSLFGETESAESTTPPSSIVAPSSTVAVVASVNPSDPQSVLKRAVDAAFAAICMDNHGLPIKLAGISRLAVFPIDSAGLPGYLVVALDGLPQSERPAFFGRSEQALKNAFTSMGVPGTLEPGFWVDMPGIAFMPWAESAGTFHFVMNHEGAEIGVAFFLSANQLPKARDAAKGMHTIGIDHIVTGHPVTFKAYLHLERNQKFFLYLRNGRELQPEQKERLKNGDVKDLYMKSVDVENLRTFLASAFLSALVKKSRSGAA